MRERFEIKFDAKISLVVYKWSNPNVEKRGTIQISHGLSEHITRYDDFANFLAGAGFIVIGDDHYQHGESCNNSKTLGQIEEYDFIDAIIKSMKLVRDTFADDFNLNKNYLFAHSMGSIASQAYLETYPNDFTAAILSGTDVGDFKYLLLKALTSLTIKKNNKSKASKLIYNLTFGSFQKKFPEASKFNWLSNNLDNVTQYENDPLCGAPVSDLTYNSIAKSLRRSFKKKNIKKLNPNLKVFLISGKEDPVSAMGKSVKKLQQKYQKHLTSVQTKLYEQMRHETLNEKNHLIVYQDILDFLNEC